MTFLLKSAWREIRNNRAFSLFYIINLSLGLVGFLTVDSFKSSLQEKVSNESKSLLGADFAIRARRPLTEEEKTSIQKLTPEKTEKVQVVDFYSMAMGPSMKSRLVKVVAMDPGFPFYGKFELKLQGSLNGSAHDLLHNRENIWIYPELRKQLDVDLGEFISIGQKKFRVNDFVMNDAGLQFQPAELAPKVFISRNHLSETKLLGQGNTAFHNSLFKLTSEDDYEKIITSIEQSISQPDIQVFSHQKAGHRAGRLLNYLSDFLGLVSLVALFLAILGSGYLFNGFIVNKINDIAILLSMGATKKTAILTFVVQLMILGLVACLPALTIVIILLPIASGVFQGLIPNTIELSINLKTVLLSFAVAVLAGGLLALPSLQKIKRLNPSNLFREASKPGSFSNKWWFIPLVPALLGFWGLTLFQSNSWKLGNLFIICFFSSALILFFLSRYFLSWLEKIFKHSTLPFRLATRSLSRNRSHSVTGFLALGLGVLLLTLIPQFQYSLEKELGLDQSYSKLPKLFLFDLQEDQVGPIVKILQKEGEKLENITPWVRGKLVKIKGQSFSMSHNKEKEMSPEERRNNRFRNRGFNLSYRDHLLESEEIIKGRMVSLEYNLSSKQPVEISVEQKYAKSLEIDLNDELEIEVGGVPILAKVVNIRRVRWTSFQPNFFVQMQPGVLDQAPKTFIATLNDLDAEKKEKIQNLITQSFPTVSILDVERTGRKILSIVKQMTWALQVMAFLSILAGLVILYSISREKVHDQKWDINLMKILGASFKDLNNIVRLEFGLLGLLASVLGVGLSSLVSFILAEFIFDKVWSFQILLPLGIVSIVVLLCIITAEWATKRTLREKPSSILQEI